MRAYNFERLTTIKYHDLRAIDLFSVITTASNYLFESIFIDFCWFDLATPCLLLFESNHDIWTFCYVIMLFLGDIFFV